MGGECNYLLRVSRDSEKRLEFVPDEQWKGQAMMAWSEEAIQSMLSSAESVLRETAHRLRLPVTVQKPPVCPLRDRRASLHCQCRGRTSKGLCHRAVHARLKDPPHSKSVPSKMPQPLQVVT